MKAEYKKILIENKRLNEEVEILKIKVDDLEQRNIGHSVEIKGVTKTINENCLNPSLHARVLVHCIVSLVIVRTTWFLKVPIILINLIYYMIN